MTPLHKAVLAIHHQFHPVVRDLRAINMVLVRFGYPQIKPDPEQVVSASNINLLVGAAMGRFCVDVARSSDVIGTQAAAIRLIKLARCARGHYLPRRLRTDKHIDLRRAYEL